MGAMTLHEAVEAMRGKVAGRVHPVPISGVCTDSRTVRPGQLFIALVGVRHDGHDHVSEALSRGAVAAVVSRREMLDEVHPRPLIWVRDTVAALGNLASYYRDQLVAVVVAVTGSCGKTTTREMIHHLLSQTRRGRQAIKSYNNHIGVPLSLLSAERNDEFLVLELGSNSPGEIDRLARLARPDVGVLVTVGPAHLEGLGSIKGVIREKTSLFRHVADGGLAVVNADCPLGDLDPPGARTLKLIRFGESPSADVRLTGFAQQPTGIRFEYNGHFEVTMPVLGRHNAVNALAAVVVAKRFGLSDSHIAERLGTFSPPRMRLERFSIGQAEIILDAYNANPASMSSAIDVLDALETDRRRVLVVGDMGELGEQSESLHRETGQRIATSRAQVLVAVGKWAGVVTEPCRPRITCHLYPDVASAAGAMDEWFKPRDLVMLKGSRVMNLETLVDRMRRRALSSATT